MKNHFEIEMFGDALEIEVEMVDQGKVATVHILKIEVQMNQESR